MKRLKNFHRWPLVGLTVAPIVLLAPIALGGVLYWGVPLLQFYPWQKLAAEMWRAGQLPLWNAWVGSGAPLAANLQTGAFYPLNFLYLILPTEHALGYTALLHVILAGWFMYAYLRALNLSRFAALIGALAFQLNGFLIARLGFLSIAVAFPWIAAWLWRVERLVVSRQWLVVSEQRVSEHWHLRRSAAPVPVSASQRINESETQRTPALAPKRSAGASVNNRKSTISNGLWLAVAIGLGVLAGHAQTAVYGLILASAYFVWRIVSLRRCAIIWSSRHLVTLAPRCGCSAGVLSLAFSFAVLIGLGLAAIQLLPAAELTRESQRASGLESIKVLTHSYWPPRLLTLLSPDFFGNPAQNNFWGYDNYWENAAYVGVLPLLLAVWSMGQSVNWSIGRLGKRSTGQLVNRSIGQSVNRLPVDRSPVDQSPITNYPLPASFFTLATVLSLVLAFGWFTPIYVFLYEHVPGFDLFQGPARWLVVTIPALCVLAALGAQRWIERGFSRRAANRLILLGLALALAGLVALFILTGRVATFGPATLRLGGLLVSAGWLFKSRIRNQKSQMIVAVVVALDLIAVHFALNPVLPPDVYRAPNPAAEAIKADGLAGRVFYFDEDEAALKFGKYLAADKQFVGYGPNDLNYWLKFRETLLPNAAMIDGVASANNFDSLIVGRYQSVLDQINALPIDQALALVSRLNVAYIVSPRSLDLPIVYRAPDVTVYHSPQLWPRAYMVSGDVDLADVPSSAGIDGSIIGSLTDSGNAITIRAASPEAGWLILNDVWYPGWQATVDGAPVPIEQASQAMRAVRVPIGRHTIEFRYEPDSVKIGLWITLACGAIVTIGLALSHRRVQP